MSELNNQSVARVARVQHERMKRVIIFTIVVFLAWQVYSQYRAGVFASLAPTQFAKVGAVGATGDFKCDQRTVCSQMTSCAEAKYFQRNCPDVDLRPDSTGVPCPLRWCSSPDAP